MDNKTFLEVLARQLNIEKSSCASMIEGLASVMEECLAEGDIVAIPSFGSFEPRKRNERLMSNPSSPGKKFLVPPKLIVSFKPSNILKNKVNEPVNDE